MISGKSFVGGPDYLRKHLSCNDYYEKGETVKGRWIGAACEKFGVKLGGEVSELEFMMLQDNKNPVTGAQLTRRKNTTRQTDEGAVANRRSFYDFTVSAPKSFSILAVTGGAEKVRMWHQNAVDIALKEMEKFAARQDHSGKTLDGIERTGNFCAATFSHDANRALEPQLHEHVIVFNATASGDGHNYAIESNEFFARCGYFTAVYRNELARQAIESGIEIEFDKHKAPQIKGMGELVNHFSSRTKDIEKLIGMCEEATGVELSRAEKKRLSLASRGISWEKFESLWKQSGCGRKWEKGDFSFQFANLVRKSSDGGLSETTTGEVISAQKDSMNDEQRKMLFELVEKVKNANPKSIESSSNAEAMEFAIQHVFERKCIVPETEILQTALEESCGKVKELGEFKNEFSRVCGSSSIISLGNMLTPTAYIEVENEIREIVLNGKKSCVKRIRDFLPSDKLSSEQAAAVESIVESDDRFLALVGDAGTGKTFSVSEIVRAQVANEVPVFMFAPSNGARDVLRGDGAKLKNDYKQPDTARPFEAAQSLQSLLCSKAAAMKIPAGSFVVLDEAGLASNKQIYELVHLARKHKWQVLFTGDPKQHTAVEAGDAFRLVLNYSGISQYRLKDIKRQKETALGGEYRIAAKEFASGKTAEAFDRLDKAGAIVEAKGEDRIRKIAEAYVTAVEAGKTAIVVNPTHRENEAVSSMIREKLKEKARIQNERDFTALKPLGWTVAQKNILQNYQKGQILVKTSGNGQGTEWDFKGIERGKGVRLRNRHSGEETLIEKTELKSYEVCEAFSMKIGIGDSVMLRMGQKQPENELSNGQIVRIKSWSEKGRPVTDEGKELTCSCISYGYAATSHKSQGATRNVVLIGLDRYSVNVADMKTAYVAATRGSDEIKIFVENKAGLELMSGRTGDRSSVTEYATRMLEKSLARKNMLANSIKNINEIFQKTGLGLKDIVQRQKFSLPFHLKPTQNELKQIKLAQAEEILDGPPVAPVPVIEQIQTHTQTKGMERC